MTGQEYLESIRTNLENGQYQHRMGRNLLSAFGYVRRRATAIDDINETLERVGLTTDPPIDADMPLRTPRIRFSLMNYDGSGSLETDQDAGTLDPNDTHAFLQDHDDSDGNIPEPAFSIYELESAKTDVECVPPSASLKTAYTKMVMHKYSQLVVANSPRPRQQDIKGIVSFQSIAKALIHGTPTTVGDCMDKEFSYAQSGTDLNSVVSQLSNHDVVMVIGQDKRLQGIITAWDLADEFANLVDPFKRIGEIEQILRSLIRVRLEKNEVAEFLIEYGLSGNSPIVELEELTMGELQRILEFPKHWNALDMVYDRGVFISGLNRVREYRNRLMHFGDPLKDEELAQIANFNDAVREIQL